MIRQLHTANRNHHELPNLGGALPYTSNWTLKPVAAHSRELVGSGSLI